MNGITILLISLVVLGTGYLLYGRWLARTWGIDPTAKTVDGSWADRIAKAEIMDEDVIRKHCKHQNAQPGHAARFGNKKRGNDGIKDSCFPLSPS